MRINSNIPSLVAQRWLNQSTKAIARALERLSSGKRIISARDDSAGLGMAVKLHAESRGTARAIMNLNESLGVLQTAESSMSIQSDLLQRMRELAVQASNSLLSTSDRQQIASEFSTLLDELDRIAQDGSVTTLEIQAGAYKDQTIELELQETTAEELFKQTVGTGNFSRSSGTATVGSLTFGGYEVADMNNDGINDIVSADWGDQRVSISYGLGNDEYASRIMLSTGATGWAGGLSIGDLNGDGIKDISVVQHGAASFGVILSNGSGSYNAITTYVTNGTTNYATSMGDADGDGDLDLAVADNAGSQVSIHSNNGSGVFTFSQTLAMAGAGANPTDVDFADFNNDGIQDILLSHVTGWDGSVFLGSGNGAFDAARTVTLGISSARAEIADLNGDGILDIVGKTTNAFTVSMGLGNGYFSPRQEYAITNSSLQFKLGDFDNDGDIDVVAAEYNTNEFSVFKNSGLGTFSLYATVATAAAIGDLEVADLNQDGILDLSIRENLTTATRSYLNQTTRRSQISRVSLDTAEDAQTSLEFIDSALGNITSARSSMGAQLNRLESGLVFLQSNKEAISTGLSRVQDADLGEETSELIKHQVLQQATTAALVQSNLQLSTVLALLRNF